MTNTPLFYRDKAVFGFDLGFNTVKLMQIERSGKIDTVAGYGFTNYNNKAVKNGVIIDPEEIAREVYELVTKNIIGSINTKRVSASIPVSRSFNRVVTLPKMPKSDLQEAIEIEAGQYIPMPLDELYLDYEIAEIDKESNQMDVLLVASPKNIVDSYLKLFSILGIDLSVLETSIHASTRLVDHSEDTDVPTLIVDFGSVSTDLSIFDSVIRVTGTVNEGGDTITNSIARSLKVTPRQANTVKTKYGLNPSKKQQEIRTAVEPMLNKMVTEIKKMVRFYQERSGSEKKLGQVIILGGGANMPGLATYLTDKIRIPTRMCNPWLNLDFGDLQPPDELERTLYATAAGLALVSTKDDVL